MTSLHEKIIIEVESDGRVKKYAALDPSRVQHVEYVRFKPLPTDGADRASIEEWLDRAVLIEEDLHWLLRLPHDRFWCQVIFDEKLHQFLDSYLCNAPRCFDHITLPPPERTLPREIYEHHDALHRLFFFLCLRTSTHHESSDDVIDPDEFGAILYENYVFDIARLMDICAIFGQGGDTSQLVGKMIDNVFKRQPKYADDLKAVVPDILQILEAVGKKCGIHYEAGSSSIDRPSQNVPSVQLPLVTMPVAEFEDIVFYLSDIAHTLCAFLKAYPSAASVFWYNDNFPIRLAAVYESLSTAFNSAFNCRVWVNDEQKRSLKKQFRLSQVCFLRVFRLTSYNACMKPVLEGKVEGSSVGILIESYVDVMNDVLSEKHFIAHLHVLFPFSADSIVMHGSSYLVDEVRLKYIQDACDDAVRKYVKRRAKPEAKVEHSAEPNHVQLGRIGDDDMEFEGPDMDDTGGACAADLSEEQIISLVSSVKDLLPDLGNGFVRLCLEEYAFDVERVINAVLEDKLLPSLQDVDRTLPDAPKFQNSGQSSVEQRKNVFDGDDFDVFSHSNVDVTRVHKGKRSTIDKGFSNVTPEIKARIAAYAYLPVDSADLDSNNLDGVMEYDDEYDDTYDSNVVGINDADSADELLSRRGFVTPRVLLAGSREATGRVDEEESEEEQPAHTPSRDAFVEDPAKLRQIREEKFAAKHQQQWGRRRAPPPPEDTSREGGNHDVKGAPRGQGQNADVLRNRAWKEKNKASRVNHNRKDLSDRKRRV